MVEMLTPLEGERNEKRRRLDSLFSGEDHEKEIREVLDDLSEAEFDLLYEKVKFVMENNDEYENSGNFILTESREAYSKHAQGWCCGIYEDEIHIGDKTFYFGFDYGH
jgi:hypothetical protein